MKAQLVGRYLKTSTKSATVISPTSVSDSPSLRVDSGKVPFLIPLGERDPLVEIINAGWKVDLYRAGQRLLENAPVIAIMCPASGSSASVCTAAIEVSSTELPSLVVDSTKAALLLVPKEP
jgi:hypothetical protein